MADPEVIKEFLVSLNFKVDAKGSKDFSDEIARATENVAQLAGSVGRASLAVFGGVSAFAANLERLHLASVQAGKSAQGSKPGADAAGNSGLDQATQDALRFMQSLRSIESQFDVFSAQVQTALMSALAPNLARFSEWFAQNGPLIAQRVAEISVKLIELVEKAIPYLGAIWDFLVALDQATDGWSSQILILLAGLNALGALSLVNNIVRLAGAFFKLGSAIAAVPAVVAGAGAVAGVTAAGAAAALLYSPSLNDGEDDIVRKRKDAQDAAAGEVRGGDYMASRIVEFLQDKGWTKEQAAGITATLSAESRFDPTMPSADGDAYGVAQWPRQRQKDFEKWAGKNIRQSRLDEQVSFVHYELTEGSKSGAGRLLRATTSAAQAGAVVSEYYREPNVTYTPQGREATIHRAAIAQQIANGGKNPVPGNAVEIPASKMSGAWEDARATSGKRVEQLLLANQNANSPASTVNRYNASSAGMVGAATPASIEIHQKTDIHVTGSSDPLSTANAVFNAQDSLSEKIARNVSSVVN